MEYKHVIITRFNIYYKIKIANKGHDPEHWLDERIRIFETFCFPSIINQTTKNYTWIIYADETTPDRQQKKLNKIIQNYKNIHILYRPFKEFNITPYINEDIINFIENKKYLITSRIDTDDMICKNYIESIQSLFNKQKYTAINFENGYLYDIKTGIISKIKHKQNAFISLIERKNNENFKTVFHKRHTEYEDDPNKIIISKTKAMWCFTVHDLNVSTGFQGKVIIGNIPDLDKEFAFKFQKKPKIKDKITFSIKSYKRRIALLKVKYLNRLVK